MGINRVDLPALVNDQVITVSVIVCGCTVALPVLADFLDVTSKGDPLTRAAAVHFQLGFAGAAQTDTAHAARAASATTGLPGQMRPGAREAWKQVFVLSQFDLQFAFVGLGVQGKNIQDQRCAVDDTHVRAESIFQFTEVSG